MQERCIVCNYRTFVDSCNFTNNDNSHTSEVEIHTRVGKIMPFWLLCCKSKAIFSKTFRPSNRDGVFIWKSFQPGFQDLSWKNLGKRASRPCHMNNPQFLQRIWWCAEILQTGPAGSNRLIWRGQCSNHKTTVPPLRGNWKNLKLETALITWLVALSTWT